MSQSTKLRFSSFATKVVQLHFLPQFCFHLSKCHSFALCSQLNQPLISLNTQMAHIAPVDHYCPTTILQAPSLHSHGKHIAPCVPLAAKRGNKISSQCHSCHFPSKIKFIQAAVLWSKIVAMTRMV